MPILALVLLLLSAVLHTSWNLLLKRSQEKYVATWWAILVGSAIFLPAVFFTGLPSLQIWPLLLISVLMEVAYYAVLSTAYNRADFSLVYPISRGAAPALIAVWSVIFLHERLTAAGILGLCIIVLGLLVMGAGNLLQSSGQKPRLRDFLLALLLALIISIYSTIDGAAVKLTTPFSYTVLVFFLAPAVTAPWALKYVGWGKLKTEWMEHHTSLIAIGLLSMVAYLLVLSAYSISLVSYSGAIREVSVVLGAFAGWKLLGERLGILRVVAAIIIFIGIVVVATTG